MRLPARHGSRAPASTHTPRRSHMRAHTDRAAGTHSAEPRRRERVRRTGSDRTSSVRGRHATWCRRPARPRREKSAATICRIHSDDPRR
jgi:hypothetical protein